MSKSGIRILRDSRGVSLLSAVVGLGIATIGMLAAGQFLAGSSKAQRSIALSNELEDVHRALQIIVTNDATCSATLQGQVYDNTRAAGNPIRVNHAAVGGVPGALIAQEGMARTGWRIQTLRLFPVPPIAGMPANRFMTELRLVGNKDATQNIGSPNFSRTITMAVNVNPATNQIISCGNQAGPGGFELSDEYVVVCGNLDIPEPWQFCSIAGVTHDDDGDQSDFAKLLEVIAGPDADGRYSWRMRSWCRNERQGFRVRCMNVN